MCSFWLHSPTISTKKKLAYDNKSLKVEVQRNKLQGYKQADAFFLKCRGLIGIVLRVVLLTQSKHSNFQVRNLEN
jgi:hypothetical protein